MKQTGLVTALICVNMVLVGCESMGPKAKTGALVGGAVGATAGGIIGHQSGHGWEGAGIGAALGAIGGGLIGNSKDKAAATVEPSNINQISVLNIVEMVSKEIPDDVIISEIQRTKSVYHLTAETVTYLKKNKVSDRLIDYMKTTGS